MTQAPAVQFSLGWESAQALGLTAVILCLALCLFAVRPRRPAGATVSLGRHALLGWAALAGAVLHVLLALLSDKVMREHLKVTAPLYEWAGIAALALLLLLTAPAIGPVRRHVWARHRSFQATHVVGSCLLVVLIAVHVVTTQRYLHGPVRTALYLALSAIALLALLRARAPGAGTLQPPRWPGTAVFGRHARLVMGITALCVVASAALLLPRAILRLREPVVRRAHALVLNFPHDRHREVNCIACHHNFTDTTGSDSCISCHRSMRADLKVGAEARFHDFCLGCHRDPPPQFTKHGPVTGCETCHVAPEGT